MLRKIGCTLLCAAAFMSSASYSMVSNSLQKGITVEYELQSNVPQVFVNYMFWAVDVNCKIATEDEYDDFFAQVLNKKARINDVTYTAGDSVSFNVHPGDNLKLHAESGAKVQITNMGTHSVRAICST